MVRRIIVIAFVSLAVTAGAARALDVDWGQSGDVPVLGDYDGNGTTDIAVYRPSDGAWYVKDQPPVVQWGGQAGDVPVPGDYDGNGDTDIAVYRPRRVSGTSRASLPSCSGAVRQATYRCPATTTATARPTSRSTARARASGT